MKVQTLAGVYVSHTTSASSVVGPVPFRLVCVGAWFPDGGAIWEGCRTSRRRSLAGGSRVLETGFQALYLGIGPHLLSAFHLLMQSDQRP